MDDVARFPVMVSDAERAEIRVGLDMRLEDLEKERKRLAERLIGTGEVETVLDLHRGDGATGGLRNRFSPRQTRDMFQEPTLDFPAWVILDGEGLDPSTTVETWDDLEDLLGDLTNGEVPPGALDGGTFEDTAERLYKADVQVSVGFRFLGYRCVHEDEDGERCPQPAGEGQRCTVHRGMDAFEEDAEGGARPDVDRATLNRALLAIENRGGLSVPHRRAMQEYARTDADAAWLEAWAQGGKDAPDLAEGWEPPEPSEVDVPEDAFAPSWWADVDATPAALDLAAEHGIHPEEVEATGKGGRVLKGDVQAVIDAGDGEGGDDA